MIIYLAPIQGFTDFVYRKAFAETFHDTDAFFIPYITLKNNQVLAKYEKETLPENNLQKRVIPQVLAKNGAELIHLSNWLKNFGYTEINLNLGCPYPMVTNRRKGAGLLPFPNQLQIMLNNFFEHSELKLSVKMRAGLTSPNEFEKIIPVLNKFPITEIIFHPRIAHQLYKGKIMKQAFNDASKHSEIPVIYNGDIFTVQDFNKKQNDFGNLKKWMIGRGVLMNPFLPSEIKGKAFSEEEKREKLIEFHQRIFESYSEKLDNQGNVLNKMVQFWIYFSYNFSNSKKAFKKIKKANDINRYLKEINIIFRENLT